MPPPRPPQTIDPPGEDKDLHFPAAGLDTSKAYAAQPNRPLLTGGKYARTAARAVNVRGYEPTTDRVRGGSRAGLVRHIDAQVAGTLWVVQGLSYIVGNTNGIGGTVQQSNSGRVVTLIAVSQGKIKVANAGDLVWTATTNNSGEEPELNFTGVVFSDSNNQKEYFCDGTNYVYYTPADNTITLWVATAGTLPQDSDGNKARLIATWRGRTVLSGVLKDPQNIFLSAIGDPLNFDYAPAETGPSDAVALNASPLGKIGDVVTGLIPYTDDVLVVLCDSSIYMLRGDPADGGSIDLVTRAIGGAWGRAYCQDPFGVIYFASNRTGIYTLTPGQQPQRISQQIDNLLDDVDTGLNSIRMLWSDREQGVHLFITRTDEPAETYHYFFDRRSGAWFQDQFANTGHNPLSCTVFDGNLATDRVALIGGFDGYVRAISMDAEDDDGTPIVSQVLIGPLVTAQLDDVMLYSLQAVLGEESGDVSYSLMIGDTAEAALEATPIKAGIWTSGRNLTENIVRSAHAIYVRIDANVRWSLESIRARVSSLGRVRMRGK